MINKDEDLSFITDEDGTETPIQVLREFDSEDGTKRFVIYTDLEDKDLEDKEFTVALIKTCEDGSLELSEVEDEADMEYCQQVFDSIIDEILSDATSEEDEEDSEETVA